MYSVGPFDGKTTQPVRPGVYFTTPFDNGLGGGFGHWDGKTWTRYKNWGGFYWERRDARWFWYGLTEAQSKDPQFQR